MSERVERADPEVLSELIRVGETYLHGIASSMPYEVAHTVAAFVVNNSTFHKDGLPRADLDDWAVNWEEYPFPLFDWPWPELKMALDHAVNLPEHLERQKRTAFGDRDLTSWRGEVLAYETAHWLESRSITELRVLQRRYGVAPARTKAGLAQHLGAISPVPADVAALADEERTRWLELIADEERNRQLPLAELYKRQLVSLVQTRVDAYYGAAYGFNSPARQREHARQRNIEAARKMFEETRGMDLASVEREYCAGFAAELGLDWENNPAARRFYSGLVRRMRWLASASFEDLLKEQREITGHFPPPEKTTKLSVPDLCPLCTTRNCEIAFKGPDDLPPFHLLCSCRAPMMWAPNLDGWKTYTNRADTKHTPRFNDAVRACVTKNIQGFGFRPPSLREIVGLIEIQMQEEEETGTQSRRRSMSNEGISQLDNLIRRLETDLSTQQRLEVVSKAKSLALQLEEEAKRHPTWTGYMAEKFGQINVALTNMEEPGYDTGHHDGEDARLAIQNLVDAGCFKSE